MLVAKIQQKKVGINLLKRLGISKNLWDTPRTQSWKKEIERVVDEGHVRHKIKNKKSLKV